MSVISLCVLSFVFCGVGLILSGVCASKPGEPCNEDTVPGDCIPLSRCPTVHMAIAQKKASFREVLCGSDGISARPFVCCPNGKPRKISVSNDETVTIRKDAPPGSRISVQKCYEFAKGVYRKEMTVALFEEYADVDTCVKIAESLIVNGEPTKKGEFPHMALLGYGEDTNKLRYDCGATLVSELFALTAAHCNSIGFPSYVLLGEHIKGTDIDGADTQLIPVQNFIQHPQYKAPAHYYDIALIRMSAKATLTPYVRPACLHSDQFYDHHKVIATGWGQLEYLDSRTSDILFKVNLDEVNDTYCERAHRAHVKLPKGFKPDQQMCVGKLEGGKDTCQGDSGGPLQVFMREPHCSYLIVGVTSFGKGCALPKTPGVYARVKHYIKWLEDTIWASDVNNTGSVSDKAFLVNSALIDNNNPITNNSTTVITGNNIPSVNQATTVNTESNTGTSTSNEARAVNTDNNTPTATQATTVNIDNNTPKANITYESTILITKTNNSSQYTYKSEDLGLNPNFEFNSTDVPGSFSSFSSQDPVDFPGNENNFSDFSFITGLLSSLSLQVPEQLSGNKNMNLNLSSIADLLSSSSFDN